ncbi:peptidase S41 [Caulobacter segnis]|uniref:Peptidase S41 n=2 Tax=Caulobacter segnis TaxID=88688 RepID=D5VEZ2_CAUST|nr:S41 family peptidase [Caulobacter segnis]ADG09410.1 peptidase S41 [Caulobacter segnis ATCC 21756]AVQ01209.1 peptidase S41 [Caulobacter segnis]
MSLDRRSLLTALTATPFVQAAPPIEGETPLPRDAVAEDVALMREAYGALHPGLLRYNDPATIEAGYAALTAPGPSDLAGFYLRLSRFLTTIRCGHTYANFYNQRAPVRRALFEGPDRLPLRFVWLGSRMVVTGDPLGLGVSPGDEVVTLNGVPAGEVLAALMTVARADGGNDAKRRQLMSVGGEDSFESFDVFYPLIFGARTRHDLVIEGQDGRRRRLLAPAMTLAQRRAQRPPQIDKDHDTPAWTMRREKDAAILTMPGWALYGAAWDWRAWLDARMDELIAQKVPRLVIDIRDNEGGLDCGDAIIARLTQTPVRKDDMLRLTRYRRIPENLKPYLDTWDRAFDDWGDDAQPYDDRFYTLARRDSEGAVIEPKGPRYAGEVRVLIGPQNSSATFQFSQLMQRERLGRLYGETTGGSRRGINGGAFYFLRLPRTGIEVDLPLIGYFPRTPQPDAGLAPDVFVPRRRETIAAGVDPALMAALG